MAAEPRPAAAVGRRPGRRRVPRLIPRGVRPDHRGSAGPTAGGALLTGAVPPRRPTAGRRRLRCRRLREAVRRLGDGAAGRAVRLCRVGCRCAHPGGPRRRPRRAARSRRRAGLGPGRRRRRPRPRAARGLRFRWASAWKSSPGRRHQGRAVYWLDDAGDGRVQLEIRRRDDEEVVARSESATAFSTSAGFERSVSTLRWASYDTVTVVPWCSGVSSDGFVQLGTGGTLAPLVALPLVPQSLAATPLDDAGADRRRQGRLPGRAGRPAGRRPGS